MKRKQKRMRPMQVEARTHAIFANVARRDGKKLYAVAAIAAAMLDDANKGVTVAAPAAGDA